MRHIHAETALPPGRSADSDLSRPRAEAALEPSSQRCARRSILMGYNETEIKRQKVYQVSIFSHLSSSSEGTEQRTGGRAAIKRGYPEQRTPEGTRDPKRTPWGGGGAEGRRDGGPGQGSPDDDDAFEDGLLVEELSLCGSAQHFSHSGLRVVEHRCEGSPSRSPKGATGDRLPDASASWPQHVACSTLHTRDSCPDLPGHQPGDCGENGERASGHNLLELELHHIAQPPQADSGGKREKVGESPANSRSPLEKTPCGSSRLGGSSCPAKRKLLPAGEAAADSCSEDESLSVPARKKRALPCHPVPTACRSTDAKGAPFWNHLLPAAKVSSSADCTAVGRRLKSGLPPHLGAGPWGQHVESILKGRFAPSGRIEGFTAEIGASGSYCPQHATLPVDVTYFDISEHSAPSPFLGVIDLEALGKKGYSVPKAGTIQVTLFNPNKTVVKMFLVTYDFQDMPANHMTFLRHRIFLVPVGEEEGAVPLLSSPRRFHSSKSGKIYLHDTIRLLFSRKSIEVDSGIPYELKSFTEMPRNPCYSPWV
uniref:Atos homolog protein B n=1 Tax=Nothoprocta perdicaria TaxID=30464 RepID=A0A8C6Z6V9_NOTPE